MTEVYMIVGFLLAAYSIVANDAIQTLGTFLSSNEKRPWWVLWIFACGILTLVMVIGYFGEGGVAYGRLEKFPMPPGGISWIHVIPPIFILILTRYGVPVSTTFLVLTVFVAADPEVLGGMLQKSAMGYGVAFMCAFVVARFLLTFLEKRFLATKKAPVQNYWIVLQWLATGWLWSQWLIQDLANIFVYLPRNLLLWQFALAMLFMYVLHAWIFYKRGGAIQKIVTSKTNLADIRSATIIDFQYGIILFIFKEMSNLPMSTTWVFLGLLAGREIALTNALKHQKKKHAFAVCGRDAIKALIGLAVSVVLAITLPAIAEKIDPSDPEPTPEQAAALEAEAGGQEIHQQDD
ncbi:MAG: hypothetical protein ACQKBV_05755 [Puniceicoccales bacterium]